MDARSTTWMTIILGFIALFLWHTTPRLMRDVWYARDYVPAQSHTMTNYECTNVNGFMFNHCSATFVSSQTHERQEITDWRFGRAPREYAQLMERRGDASSVTTDVSLRTTWNRMLMMLFLLGFGVCLALSPFVRSRGDTDTPEDGSAPIPAREGAMGARVGRSEARGFGRRTRKVI